jgi:8-oxo-dGTP pyrophosphatase MutT (NUDIX family)
MGTGIVGRVPKVRERLSINLDHFERRALDHTGLRAAAVAVTLCMAGGVPSFVLTRRTDKMRRHAGQWALPGGRTDEGETPEQAARRELLEEVGLAVGPESVLGLLDDYATRSGFVITPVVVWAGDDPIFVADPHEVAEVHVLPLAQLERPDSPRFITIPESPRPVVQLPLVDTLVHAPTAAILYQMREVLVHGRSTRVAHLEQPVFAWT